MKLYQAIVIILCTVILNCKIFGQSKKNNYLFNSFEFGSSLTLIGYENIEVKEYTWNINFATSIGKHFYSGIQVLNIYLDYPRIKTKKYNIFGLFGQYNFTPNSRFRSFFEMSINRGNYYFKGTSYFPEEVVKMYYLGIGGGVDIPLDFLSNRLFLDLSFVFYFHNVDNNLVGYMYNQYIVGLNYRFGKAGMNREKTK